MKKKTTTKSSSLIRSDFNLLALGLFAAAVALASFWLIPNAQQIPGLASFNLTQPDQSFASGK